MIPKTIHYCWFGGNPLPELALRCIESWKKFCADCEIIEWNESNFDVNACAYTREAYQAKKWAFVSDYARFQILYEHGGLYFDTDVELIRPLDDLLARGAFMGREYGDRLLIAPGLGLAAEPGMEFYREMLEGYRARHYLLPDGTPDGKTVVDYTTVALERHGLQKDGALLRAAGVTVYPAAYFCPMDYDTGALHITDETRSIHHYCASWHNEAQQYALELKRKMARFLPRRPAAVLATAVAKTRFEGFGACMRWVFKRR